MSVCNNSKVTALTKCYEILILNSNHLIISQIFYVVKSTSDPHDEPLDITG